VLLTLDGTPAAGWSPVSLGAALQREPRLIGVPLARALRERGAARAIVPAVLGMADHGRVHAAVEDAAGVAVGEALGTAPSLPGWRLDLALQAALAQAGVRMITGTATITRDTGDIEVRRADGTDALRAGAVVNATGKFVGGGVAAYPHLHDAVSGSGVVVEWLGRRFSSAADSLTLTDPVRTAHQALLTAGVADGQDSAVLFAGSVRDGVETAALGLGAAAADGWRAGEQAAARVRP
jgi:anaerobic glycerol-3-phosphate dehydrogenase